MTKTANTLEQLAQAPAAAPGTKAQFATFTVERRIKAAPARVYRAFSDPEAKKKWFGGDPKAWKSIVREMDFRPGGKERARGQWQNGATSDFQCTYHDIVPERRIVYVYDLYVNDQKLSVSLATIEIFPDGADARLVITEQGVFFDGGDDAKHREQGTNYLMDVLKTSVESTS